MKKVLEHLAKKYSNVKEEVGAIMGGKILDYEAKDILNAGRTEMKVQDILELLEDLGEVPEDVKQKICVEQKMDILKRWFKLAAKSQSIDEFVNGM